MNDSCRKLPRSLAALAVAAGLLGSVSPPGQATTIAKLGMAEMVEAADAIVIGHARGVESVWVGRHLYTRYRIEVQESLLGAPAAEVTVVVPGGVDMNRPLPIAVTYVDAPILRRDEHVALLLKRGSALGADAYTIVGFNQGRITLDSAAGAPAAGRQGATAGRAAGGHRLDRLRTELRALVAARAQAPAATTARAATPQGRPGPRTGTRTDAVVGR